MNQQPRPSARGNRRDRRPAAWFAGVALVVALAVVATEARAEGPAPAGGRGGVRLPVRGPGGELGVALTLVVVIAGGAILAVGRLRANVGAAGGLRVVGRAHLTGRHAVYLLRAGDRTLIVGVGAQGPPSLLGELDAEALDAGPTGQGRAA